MIRKRTAALLMSAAGLMGILLLAGGSNLIGLPIGNEAAASIKGACTVQYYALDPNDATKPNPNKVENGVWIAGAFGPAVAARDEAGVKKELDERRECGTDGKFDPALTAAHYAEWSHNGLTSIKVNESPTGLNAFTAQMASDVDLRGKVLAELKKLEGESTFSIASVSQGIWSLYMTPNGNGGVDLKVGRTSANGTNAVFTHGDKVIRYRLDCGFQPNRETPFTNVPECTGEECAPPPTCPPGTVGPWPECPTPNPCPPGNLNPDCAPKSGDKQDYEYPAGKPPVTVTEPGTDSPTPVQTEVPGPVVTDTPTNPPGSETGGQAPDATPAPTNPSPPPPNEGDGTNDGTVGKP